MGIPRYEMVSVTKCGEAWQELQRDDEYGEWVRFEAYELAERTIQELRSALTKAERCLTELYPSEPCKPEHENEYYAVNAVINQARAVLEATKNG